MQGDVLLWNGSTEILSVELKTLKDHEGADQTVESLRLQKVDSQAQKGEVFALSFLAQKPQPLPLKLAMLATGELPSVHGISVTNHFNEEHHPSLSEKAREQLKEGFREFRFVPWGPGMVPRATYPLLSHSLDPPLLSLAPITCCLQVPSDGCHAGRAREGHQQGA